MALMHFSLKSVSRSTGRSSVAAAAYRSGTRLMDERTGELMDYTRRSGVLFTEVILPGGHTMPREALWNAAELAEKRKDAKVAREFVVALPWELSQEQQKALVVGYAQGLSARTGWAVDVAIHAPGREGDQRNTHAHLLCTTRSVEYDRSGSPVLGPKTRKWDVLPSSKELVSAERTEWANQVNLALEQAGHEMRVDARSYSDQGLEILPTSHLGVHANAMERRGEQTERGDYNRHVQDHNAQVVSLNEVREKRAEEAAWQKEFATLETIPLKDLKQKVYRYRPERVEDLVTRMPKVQHAYNELTMMDKKRTNLQQALGDIQWHLRKQDTEQQTWRETHQIKAWLHDKGLFKQAVLFAYEKRIQDFKHQEKDTQGSLAQTEASYAKAEHAWKRERILAEPKAQAVHQHQLDRYEQVKALLAKRQSLEKSRKNDRSQDLGR